MTEEAALTLVNEGRPVEIGRPGRRRTVKVGRTWRVDLAGECIGFLHYRMITRERRTGQRVYVDARWESPGWMVSRTEHERGVEQYSRKDAVAFLVRVASQREGDR